MFYIQWSITTSTIHKSHSGCCICIFSAKSEPLLLPHIPGTPPTTRHDGSGTRKSSAGRKKEVSEKKESQSKGSLKDQPGCEDLGLSGVGVQQRKGVGSNPPGRNMIDVRGVIQSAIKDASSDIYHHTEDPHHGDRLLRPIAGFAGYNSEMRDLAAVVAKVSSKYLLLKAI